MKIAFHYVHMARKVVGVGSVGTRAWILLMLGRDDQDPLFLQAKEAQESVLSSHLPREVVIARPGGELVDAHSHAFPKGIRALGGHLDRGTFP